MNAIAKAYGDALFEIALDLKKCDEYRKNVSLLKDSMDERWIQLLNHPKISKDEKKKLLEKVYEGNLDPVLINFLKVLVDKNRFRYVKEACDAFDEDYVDHFNILVAHVTSAQELNEDEKKRLNVKLEKKMQQSVECIYDVDPKLLAGIKVKIKDFVMDNTALNRLTNLKNLIEG